MGDTTRPQGHPRRGIQVFYRLIILYIKNSGSGVISESTHWAREHLVRLERPIAPQPVYIQFLILLLRSFGAKTKRFVLAWTNNLRGRTPAGGYLPVPNIQVSAQRSCRYEVFRAK